MKSITFVLVLFSCSAFAAETPLITKASGGGFIAEEMMRSESCEVYLDHVVVTKSFGLGQNGFQQTETRKVEFSPSIRTAIAKALTEELKSTGNGVCDMPVTSILIPTGDSPSAVLFQSGACGRPRQERSGPYSRMLRDLVDSYCPQTYDIHL